jgi:Transketolase, thiamine diphosphate binding domain
MTKTMDELCVNTIRTLAMDAVQRANSGHPGTPMARRQAKVAAQAADGLAVDEQWRFSEGSPAAPTSGRWPKQPADTRALSSRTKANLN